MAVIHNRSMKLNFLDFLAEDVDVAFLAAGSGTRLLRRHLYGVARLVRCIAWRCLSGRTLRLLSLRSRRRGRQLLRE
jgi:hypothetical protein